MAEPVHIPLDDPAAARDLARALVVRGLPAVQVSAGGNAAVELRCRREQTQRLLDDLLPALEAWVEDRRYAPLLVHVGEQSYALGLRLPAARAAGADRWPAPPARTARA